MNPGTSGTIHWKSKQVPDGRAFYFECLGGRVVDIAADSQEKVYAIQIFMILYNWRLIWTRRTVIKIHQTLSQIQLHIPTSNTTSSTVLRIFSLILPIKTLLTLSSLIR